MAHAGIVVAGLNLVALIVHFCVDKFIINQLPWDDAYIRNFGSFIIISIAILVIAVPQALPLAVNPYVLSLTYSVKVRSSDDRLCGTVSLAASVRLTVAARAADNAASEQFTTQYGRR